MLSFVKKPEKKVAYAASLDVTQLPNWAKKTYKKFLLQYSRISVREENAVKIINDLTKKSVAHVLDPTMLLSPEDWNSIADGRQSKQEIKGKYLLCYFVGSNPNYWQRAEELAGRLDLRIVVIPYTPESYYLPYEKLYGCGPEDFLSSIRDAEFICTDSFHATVFSINFRKKFLAMKRFEDSAEISQNSRITSLLGMLGLEDKLIGVNDSYESANLSIEDYEEVHKKLAVKRRQSQNYLMSSINLK